MSIFKKIGKLITKIIPGRGIIGELISPERTPEQVQSGLAMLDPIAQYNRTMARPRIALSIVYVYLLGIVTNWILQICGQPPIIIPDILIEFAKVVIGAYIGSRGLEKIAESIFKKKK